MTVRNRHAFALALGLAGGLAVAGARADVVQLDLSADFNADVVVNDGLGALDRTQDPIDQGLVGSGNFCFPSQSVAESMAPVTPDGLPDDAFFPANAQHPDVQLAWRNDDDGLNAWRLQDSTGRLVLNLPPATYLEVHVYATSGNGPVDIELTALYADGPGIPVTYTVPDWFGDPAGTLDEYVLIDGRDRMQPGSGPGTMWAYEESNNPAIFGYRLPIEPGRDLLNVTVDRTDTSGVLSVFGAVALTDDPPEACCFPDGSCLDLGPGECATAGGSSEGPGTDCATAACPQPGRPGWLPDGALRAGEPLRVVKGLAGELDLSWGVGCSDEVEDHAVFEGPMESWYDHEAVLCSTGGAMVTEATILAAPGNRYFLLVPVTGLHEGSYGLDSMGNERPVSPFRTCRDEQDVGCP